MHISWRGIASFYIADWRTKWMDVLQTVIAASHNYSPQLEARVCARARVHRLAKCNKCTHESNKRQTPMTNRQTISVPSAMSGDLFVIKDGMTINPVERICQQFDACYCCFSSLRDSEKTIIDTANRSIYAYVFSQFYLYVCRDNLQSLTTYGMTNLWQCLNFGYIELRLREFHFSNYKRLYYGQI